MQSRMKLHRLSNVIPDCRPVNQLSHDSPPAASCICANLRCILATFSFALGSHPHSVLIRIGMVQCRAILCCSAASILNRNQSHSHSAVALQHPNANQVRRRMRLTRGCQWESFALRPAGGKFIGLTRGPECLLWNFLLRNSLYIVPFLTLYTLS